VHIESNDIFVLKSRIPNPLLVSLEPMARVVVLLREEDVLHLNSRALCARTSHWVGQKTNKMQEQMNRYSA
jgi:hypothetical protein